MENDRRGRAASGPVTRANGDQTKEKILDAAEELFGAHSFDTVSLRDITNHAGVTLALASYHFGTKDNLFSAVMVRRAHYLNQMRISLLGQLDADGSTDVGAYIDAFLRPFVTQAISEDAGWKSYIELVSKVALTNRWNDLVRDHYDELANQFIARIRPLLPDHSEEALYRGFAFGLQLGLQIISQNRRVDSLSGGKYSGRDLEASYAYGLKFVTAGMLGLASK
ncbi:TetR/AcrR family transcriptional regulator [Rhizobium sp.]